MPLTVIEYSQALAHLKRLVARSPFAETVTGDVHCFYCHEYQVNVNEPVHGTHCEHENARQWLEDNHIAVPGRH